MLHTSSQLEPTPPMASEEANYQEQDFYNKEAARNKLRDVEFKTENTNIFIYLKSEEEDEWSLDEKIKIRTTDGEWSCIAL